MTVSEKRKAAQREASRKNREQKKADGYVNYRRVVLPEWMPKLDDALEKLRKNLKKKR